MPGRLDLLLNVEIFYELLLPGQICPANSSLIFQDTFFGYIASGSVPVEIQESVNCGFIEDNTGNKKCAD